MRWTTRSSGLAWTLWCRRELEKTLGFFNSNRLRTFEGARSEIVTYVEEKFGLRIRDFEPSKAEFCKR